MATFIREIIKARFGEIVATELYQKAFLLQYLDNKTKSVDRSSKSRGSFANIYAIYVLVENYINKGFYSKKSDYSTYEGMMFTDALNRTRELPFGEKIKNHALNNRCNDEFKKFFVGKTEEVPIIRNLDTKRYWINEKLLIVKMKNGSIINIALLCIEIINKYIELKMENFESFFNELKAQKGIVSTNPKDVIDFISELLKPNSDARIFEIVSYVIVKYHFLRHNISYSIDGGKTIKKPLTVYKTGRTNANDGGIDFIMIPLGRIFQVTEVLDFKKYFLDIDKLIYYPITFIVKQDITPKEALSKIKEDASKEFTDKSVLERYLNCFEEIITIPTLKTMLTVNINAGFLSHMVDELISQCKVEYNIE